MAHVSRLYTPFKTQVRCLCFYEDFNASIGHLFDLLCSHLTRVFLLFWPLSKSLSYLLICPSPSSNYSSLRTRTFLNHLWSLEPRMCLACGKCNHCLLSEWWMDEWMSIHYFPWPPHDVIRLRLLKWSFNNHSVWTILTCSFYYIKNKGVC